MFVACQASTMRGGGRWLTRRWGRPVRFGVRLALLGVMFGLLLSMLDNFIVGTALPSIVRELDGAKLLA